MKKKAYVGKAPLTTDNPALFASIRSIESLWNVHCASRLGYLPFCPSCRGDTEESDRQAGAFQCPTCGVEFELVVQDGREVFEFTKGEKERRGIS